MLVVVVDSFEEAFLLFFFADMQKEFQHQHVVVGPPLFHGIDFVVPAFPEFIRAARKLMLGLLLRVEILGMDAHDQDFL